MNIIKEIEKINKEELRLGISESASWHAKYKNSAYVFVSGIDYEFSEGDIICIFSQFGEVVDCNLIRNKKTGASMGYAFVAYEDQRSTVLAVDNFNGTKINNRFIRCDHVLKYRRPVKPNLVKQEGESSAEEGQSDDDYESRRKQIWDPSLYYSSDDGDEMEKKVNKKEKRRRSKINVDKLDKKDKMKNKSRRIKKEKKLNKKEKKLAKKEKKLVKKEKKERRKERRKKKKEKLDMSEKERMKRVEEIRRRREEVRKEERRGLELFEQEHMDYINQVELATIQKTRDIKKKYM